MMERLAFKQDNFIQYFLNIEEVIHDYGGAVVLYCSYEKNQQKPKAISFYVRT